MIPFHLIQYSTCNNGSISPNRHILLVLGLTIIKHVIHAHLITMVIQVCIYKTDFVQIFVKFDYWYITV